MISYLGFPIAWPNGEIFGTICVLDEKKKDHDKLHIKLLSQFRDVVQEDLRWLTAIAVREIVDLIPVMIGVMTPDGSVLYANKAILDYTGFSIDDAVQHETTNFLRGIHPEDIERLRNTCQKAMRGHTANYLRSKRESAVKMDSTGGFWCVSIRC